jgi:hypothetical protein
MVIQVFTGSDDVSLRVVLGEEELAIAWLAEKGVLPVKNKWGRFTLREPPGQSKLTEGETLLILENLGITSKEDLEAVQQKVRNHPRWDE